MPQAFVRKVARKHHKSVAATEEKWQKAKRLAAEQGKGGNYAYVTGIFKHEMNEQTLPTFKRFLITEADVETSATDSVELEPNIDADQESDADVATEPNDFDDQNDTTDLEPNELEPSETGGDFGADFNLATDERFKEIEHSAKQGDTKAQGIVNRLRNMEQTGSPQEVEYELQTTWEKMFGGKGIRMSSPDDMHHMGGSVREAKLSLLASLITEKWNEPAEVHHTGENTNKSVSELRHELTSAKKAGDTKRMRQKNFAIRAKTHWGRV